MHAALIAEELEIHQLIIPDVAGEFSAWGMLNADIRHDLSKSFSTRLNNLDWNEVQHGFSGIEAELSELMQGEGVPTERMRFLRYLDIRYISQEYFVSVPIPAEAPLDASQTTRFKKLFDDLYMQQYGHSNPEEQGELANIRVEARGLNSSTDGDPRALISKADAAAEKTRPVVFSGKRMSTRFLDRSILKEGESLEGPLVINELSCTTVVPPDYRVELDSVENLVIQKNGAKR